MKKMIYLMIAFSFLFLVVVVYQHHGDTSVTKDNDEVRAIFISYIELNKYIKNKEVDVGKQNINSMINHVKNLGFNTIILQIRSFSDAIYKSSIFPWSSTVSNEEGVDPGYDILAYFIDTCHDNHISLYGWINPYRVRSSTTTSISEKNPAFLYIGTDYLYEDEGIYYNPSKQEVEDLIVEGVEEVVKNYKVDGILFDDYFYPNRDLDYLDYLKYLEDHSQIGFDEYHFMIINKMVKRVHDVCLKNHVLFGISPDGNIDNNYNKVFADVRTWLSSDLYVDFIMPQVYYGFFNETRAFKNVIDEWNGLIKNSNVKLHIALAFYKVGMVDQYAKSGVNEWVDNSNIIMREIILSRNLKHYQGFSLFRYDYLFDNKLYTNTTMLEIENMKKVLN